MYLCYGLTCERRKFMNKLLLLMIFLLPGCVALMQDHGSQVEISSNPSESKVFLLSNAGQKYIGTTPLEHTFYLNGNHTDVGNEIFLTKPGYANKQFVIDSKLSPWFYANIIFPPGFLLDMMLGAIYIPRKGHYHFELQK